MPCFPKSCIHFRNKNGKRKDSKTIKQITDITTEVTNAELWQNCRSSSSNTESVNNNASTDSNRLLAQSRASIDREEPTMNEPKASGVQKICSEISISGYDADKPIDTTVESDLIVVKAEDAKCELACETTPEIEDSSFNLHSSEKDSISEKDSELVNEIVESVPSSLCDVASIKVEDGQCEMNCKINSDSEGECPILLYSDEGKDPEKEEETLKTYGSESFTLDLESITPCNEIQIKDRKANEIIDSITVCSDVFEKIEELRVLEFFDLPENVSDERGLHVVEKYIDDSCDESEDKVNESAKKDSKGELGDYNQEKEKKVNESATKKDSKGEFGDYHHEKKNIIVSESKNKDYEEEKEDICNSEYGDYNYEEESIIVSGSENGDYEEKKEDTCNSECGDGNDEVENKDSSEVESGNCNQIQEHGVVSDLVFENDVDRQEKKIACDIKWEGQIKNQDGEIKNEFDCDKKEKYINYGNGDIKQCREDGQDNGRMDIQSCKLKLDMKYCALQTAEEMEFTRDDMVNIRVENENKSYTPMENVNLSESDSFCEAGDCNSHDISEKVENNFFDNFHPLDDCSISITTLEASDIQNKVVEEILLTKDNTPNQHENVSNNEGIRILEHLSSEHEKMFNESTELECCTSKKLNNLTQACISNSNACEGDIFLGNKNYDFVDKIILHSNGDSEQEYLNESADSKNKNDAGVETVQTNANSLTDAELDSETNDAHKILPVTSEADFNSNNHLTKDIEECANSEEKEHKGLEIVCQSQVPRGTVPNFDAHNEIETNYSEFDATVIECRSSFTKEFLELTSNSMSDIENVNFEVNWPEESSEIEIFRSQSTLSVENNVLCPGSANDEQGKLNNSKEQELLHVVDTNKQSETSELGSKYNMSITKDIHKNEIRFPFDYENGFCNNNYPQDTTENFDHVNKNDFSFRIDDLLESNSKGNVMFSTQSSYENTKKLSSANLIEGNISGCTNTMLPNPTSFDLNGHHQTSIICDEKMLEIEYIDPATLDNIYEKKVNCKDGYFTNNYTDDDSEDTEDSGDNDSDDTEANAYVKSYENLNYEQNYDEHFNSKYSKIQDKIFQNDTVDSGFVLDESSKTKNHEMLGNTPLEHNCLQDGHLIRNLAKIENAAWNFFESVNDKPHTSSFSIHDKVEAEIRDPFNLRIPDMSLQKIISQQFEDDYVKKSDTPFSFEKNRDRSLSRYSVSSLSDSSDSTDMSENGDFKNLAPKGSKSFIVSAWGDNNISVNSVPESMTSELQTENFNSREFFQDQAIDKIQNSQIVSKNCPTSEMEKEKIHKIHIPHRTRSLSKNKMAMTTKNLDDTPIPSIPNEFLNDLIKRGHSKKLNLFAKTCNSDCKKEKTSVTLMSKIENLENELELKSNLHGLDGIEVCRRQCINSFLQKKTEILSQMNANMREVPIEKTSSLKLLLYNASNNYKFNDKHASKSPLWQNKCERDNTFSELYKLHQSRKDKTEEVTPRIPKKKFEEEKNNHQVFSSDADSDPFTDQSAKMTPERKRILDASRDIRSPKHPFKITKSIRKAALYKGKPVLLKPSKVDLVAYLTKGPDNSYQIKKGYRIRKPYSSKSKKIAANRENEDCPRSRDYRCRAVSPDELKLKFDDLFKKYASRGRPNGELMSYKRSTEWLKDAGLIGKSLTTNEANDVFKCIAGVKIALNKGDYRTFLQKLTRLKRLNYLEIYERLCSTTNV